MPGETYQATLRGTGGADPDGCYVNGRHVPEARYRAHMEKQHELWLVEQEARKSLPKLSAPAFHDRDGRWALANHGRGTECPTLSDDPRRPVFVESKGDMERLAASKGHKLVPIADMADRANAKNPKWKDTAVIPDEVEHV
jgi:hypothetical protein